MIFSTDVKTGSSSTNGNGDEYKGQSFTAAYANISKVKAQMWKNGGTSDVTVVLRKMSSPTVVDLAIIATTTIADADIGVPNGMPLVWASRLLGGNLTDRCYGPTLMEKT